MGTEVQQLKPALVAQFLRCDASHRHETNRLAHKLAIPLIGFHILAMLMWIPLGSPFGFSLTLGHVAYAAAVAAYLALDVRLGVLMALLLAVCFPIAAITPKAFVIVLALVGWLALVAGHVVWEKRQPTLVTYLIEAFVWPLYFVATLVGLWPHERAVTA
jgi:uncharacterized membrane protein YGL010W